ncbi:TIGR02301 family protein [Siculibacillus lacustris]|uniref:TIGR02301 family protein n=1 Tax=Siculibacillus lacustris TaxID=1549641 RepID=UPI001D1987EA|nr:TIGR02301 family protein [Siculibacillus lacustris]
MTRAALALAGVLAAGLATTSFGGPPLVAASRAAETAPYDDQLLRLAEILGALHHLRPLCGADEAQTWRNQMTVLLDAEQPAPERRRRLVDRFNQSYRGLAEIHRVCSATARDLAARYTAEGASLSRDVVARWGVH